MDRLIELFAEEFEKQVGTKTGWGKNEIMVAFYKASVIAMSKYAKEKNITLD